MEQTIKQEPVEQPEVEQQEVVESPGVQTVEEQASSTAETAEPTPETDEQFLIKTVVDGQEQVFDIRDAEQRKTLQENAQKGFGYTKKMQSLSEWEKANQSQLQFSQMIMNDPDILKISVARQNGLDPASLYGQLQMPDPSLVESNSVLYNQLLFDYQTKAWQRQQIENMTQAYGKIQADMNNSALFERARIEHELNDQEFNQVKTFLTMNFRPNNFNMYTKEQMDVAAGAIVGKTRQAQQQMTAIQKIDKSIKTASQPQTASVKVRPVAPAKKDTDDFHRYVREKVRS